MSEIFFILECLHPPRVQQGRQCAGHLANTRHGAYLKYTQNIVLQNQGEDPTGKPTSLICSTNPTAVSLRGHRRGYHQPIDRSGLTPPPVYSEAWAKGNAEVSPEHHFPPYGTPHTANMRVGKPTLMPRKFLTQIEIENLMKNLNEENFDERERDSDSEFEDEFENSILENNEIELDVSANFDDEADGLFAWKEVEGSEMIKVLPFFSKVGLKVDAISYKTENDFF
ncbi:DDE_Tnp_1_7 domain-containing protein [Trichonephila clavipes]|nr:DDE_Tnp_1_7 domain-containing protein [Trichonephila clavipes]